MQENNYNNCLVHPQELLQLVCLDCEENCLACPLCVDIYHQNHSIISLKKFMAIELNKLYDGQVDETSFLNKLK